MLSGKRILLIIGGGISAYRSLELIRLLRKRDCSVTTCMTDSAKNFVTPLSVSALSGEKVHLDLFDLTEESEMGHIELSRSADLVIIAPCTADFMSKIANGSANDLASTLILATDKPVLVAPAMNVKMWENLATKRNLSTLLSDGLQFVGPNHGDMACGDFGPGRMSEPEEIILKAEKILKSGPLQNKHIIVTSGPTHEPIDPIRYIGNRSSGAQGTAIASTLSRLGADVTFISGPSLVEHPKGVKIIEVETADQMFDEVNNALPATVAIFAAAVADWKVENEEFQKIKKAKNNAAPTLILSENKDILRFTSRLTKNRPKLVIGFAAETEKVIEQAILKRKNKNCDWIIANDVGENSSVMGGEYNTATFITETNVEEWQEMSKVKVAEKLAKRIIEKLK